MPTVEHSPAASRPAAQLSEPLAALFPAGVIAAELRVDPLASLGCADGPAREAQALQCARALLTEAEWRTLAQCREPRIRDFTAGRLCAHRALQAFGIQPFSVLAAPDRQALWPPAMSGSITHTQGYAAAVVGRLAEVGSLGIDCERIQAVPAQLWPQICTGPELEQLAHWPASQRARGVALCFVAKEAFYKAQFALCGEPLEFDALRVQLPQAPLASGALGIHPLRALRVQRHGGDAGAASEPTQRSQWTGRYCRDGDYVIVGIALPAATARIE